MYNIQECSVSVRSDGIQVTDQQLLSQFQAILDEQYGITFASCIAANSEAYVKIGSSTLLVRGVRATNTILFYEGTLLLVSFRYVERALKSIWIGYGSPIVTIDLDASGRRLEGVVLENGVAAKGSIFNENNSVAYCGTVINNKYNGFGVSFFEDIAGSCIHLIGFFHEGETDGVAVELSRTGDILRAGVWNVGVFIPSFLRIDKHMSLNQIHRGVKEVVVSASAPPVREIGSSLSQSPLLEKLVIETNALSSMEMFHLSDLLQLQSIIIGDHVMTCKQSNSLNKDQSFSLQNLPSLKVLQIGADSFTSCTHFSISHCDHIEHIKIGAVSEMRSSISSSFYSSYSFSLQRTL